MLPKRAPSLDGSCFVGSGSTVSLPLALSPRGMVTMTTRLYAPSATGRPVDQGAPWTKRPMAETGIGTGICWHGDDRRGEAY